MTPAAPSLPPPSGGFTLLETLVAIAVLAVLMSLAAPSMRAIQLRWEVRGASHAMESSLVLARSEAIRRAGKVVVRRLDTPCAVSGAADQWNCGWVVFVDLDGDGVLGKGDTVLQTVDLSGSVQVVHSAKAQLLRLDRYGGAIGVAGSHSFAFAPMDSTVNVGPGGLRMLCLSPGARIKETEGTTC